MPQEESELCALFRATEVVSFERKVEAQSTALAHDSGSFGHKDLEGCVVWV